MVPPLRLARLNDAPVRPERAFVLYWMIAARRSAWNFALDHAVAQARALGRPLLVLEALRVDHRWASARFHQFVLDGMRDQQAAFTAAGITYYPYLEPSPGAGAGLVETLARQAALVVTDEAPLFFLPRMVRATATRLDVAVDAVDSNGLLPLRAVDAVYPTAYAFRRVLQQRLPAHFSDRPSARLPDAGTLPPPAPLPEAIRTRWPDAFTWLDAHGGSLASLPIDHTVTAAPMRGGALAARARLQAFLAADLGAYGDQRNHPDRDATSQLSPYLHWGHISTHEVFHTLMAREGWIGDVASRATGGREGWWGVSPAAESFLDELITWRELGYNMTFRRDDYDQYESLPDWARRSLDAHTADPRPHLYPFDVLDGATTGDALWNAAQRQLRREGRMHNYLRMLWGKKILEWTASPREAARVMIELNNRYALDGRNPNSYSGIFWVLGRYDRPWAPVRPIFGAIRYMSSANTARKLRVREYLERYAAD
ncbi:MAG: hypothetical protein Q8L86_04090 [Vicinamibacterales bacterium]|nr:hypothetical protein [Vicinamibacterales bacterium]